MSSRGSLICFALALVMSLVLLLETHHAQAAGCDWENFPQVTSGATSTPECASISWTWQTVTFTDCPCKVSIQLMATANCAGCVFIECYSPETPDCTQGTSNGFNMTKTWEIDCNDSFDSTISLRCSTGTSVVKKITGQCTADCPP